MKFGINTWFFQELSVREALNKIREIGFRAAEVWMEHLLKTDEKPEDIKYESDKLGLELSLHGASYDINLTSINRGIREESKRQAEEAIIAGRKLGASIIVLHPGKLSASRVDKVKCRIRMVEIFEFIDEIAERESVRVGIEAMEKRSREIYVAPEYVQSMLEKGWKKIGLTLDIAHAFTLMDPIPYMRKINKSWIYHVHISDAAPGKTHIPLGEGNIDINSILRELNEFYNGLVIIEGYVPGEGERIVRENYRYLKSLNWIT